MKKHGIGGRLLSLLLVLAMVMSFLPVSVFAAVGDIATGTAVGDTGLDGNINTQDTISWPIKIYDFLNDGMLFEYANAGDSGDIPDEVGGAYGGGSPAPQFEGAVNIIGTDYTVNWGYNEASYATWLNTYSAFVYPALVEAVNFKSPSHLHLVPDKSYTDMRPWIMSDFYTDNTTSGYSKDTVRYAVVVYRTSGLEDGEAKLNLGWSTNLTGGTTYSIYTAGTITYDYRGSVDLVANSDKWNYVVVDMKAGNLGTKWDSITNVYRVFADFHMNEPTDSVDISHVAYFDTKFEAIEFGEDAVAFDNDPGEYLNAHTEYTDSQQIPVSKPTTGYNGMDFSVSDNSTGGYIVDTYKGWTTAKTGLSWIGTIDGVSVTEVENGERSYVQVSNKNRSTNGNIKIWDYSGGGSFTHVTIVYKTTNFTKDDLISFYVRFNNGGGANMYSNGIAGVGDGAKITLAKSENEWTYVTYEFSQIDKGDTDYVAGSNYNTYGLYLPACMTGKDMSLDIAMVNVFTNASDAKTYGEDGAAYMNGKTTTNTGYYTTTTKKWNTGNNVAFSMLYAGQGGGWTTVNGNTMGGGASSAPSGYYSYGIGKAAWTGTAATEFNSYRTTAATKGYPVSDSIFLLNSWSLIEDGETTYDMSELELGYTLINYLESGVMTAGLLESSLTTVTANGTTYRVPDYKEDTVEYIAYLLKNTLIIPRTDANGNYNYNYVQGTANGEQYGYDGTTPLDLASALRKQLGITFTSGANYGTIPNTTVVGDYSSMTDAQKAGLIGSFSSCKDNIKTFVDAAYYLLMNLYVDDSYNQTQDEYNYLELSQATLDNGQTGYVFDAGFTTGNASDTANTDAYRASSQSAVEYDKKKGTISLTAATSKDQVYFSTGNTATTRFPFLPVTDATGVYAGETKSPYFLDDGRGPMGVTEEGATFVNRNYNYAMVSNGEFIYHEEDQLFFQFEGDDDVYLFINGELVLDIGAAHSITSVSMNVNDYVEWAKKVLAEEAADSSSHTDAEVARAEKLNLVEGESYTFDFYYMERHGWGANCRIATNIRVTDPTLKTDKTAYQSEEEVPYGGAVKGDQLVEYSFSMTNEGNSKLYNLDFKDGNIGVTLDHTLGLVTHGQPAIETIELSSVGDITISGFNGAVNMDGTGAVYTSDNTVTLENVAAGSHTLVIYQMNSDPYQDVTAAITYGSTSKNVTLPGVRATDADGNTLDYSDLVITVDGYSAEDKANKLDTITVKVSSHQELIDFLQTLKDPNGKTDSNESSSGLFGGAGLWRYATVTIRGIYYRLTNEQKEAGLFDNTVYTYATPSPSSTAVIKGQDVHRVYVTGAPTYYQWAGHNLFISEDKLKEDTIAASDTSGNQLTEYADFFKAIKNGDAYETDFCDKFGNTCTYPEVKQVDGGYQVNYSDAGTYAFYLLMYLKDTDISDLSKLEKSQYAVVRVTVYVADVEDSVYVLDYGLTTEDLGTDGELFKSDNLFGADTSNKASLMGIAAAEPSYVDYKNRATGYNRIDFSGLGEDERIQIDKSDGYFSTNLVIPKEITYNSVTKTYSLTEVGTNTITVKTPADWNSVYLYYWYDGGTSNGWPGTAMTKDMTGQFSLDIPGDVANVIINNGNGDQTGDIMITPGLAATITVDEKWSYTTTTAVSNVTIYVEKVPDSWENVYLYYWYEGSNTNNGWPGTAMTEGSDGTYSLSIPGNVDKVIINNGANEQTSDITLGAGKDTTITVGTEYSTSEDGNTKYYKATHTTTDRTCVIHVKVPDSWTTVNLYYWNSATAQTPLKEWPGEAMTKGQDGWYELEIPADMTYVIVNNGDKGKQTVDLSMRPDLETWITVTDETATNSENYLAEVDYRAAITFTPTDFMDDLYQIWMAVSVHDVNFTPSALSDGTIDITNEVQMYKTITVLPASVVYYEDDFPAIHYQSVNEDGSTSSTTNVIVKVGSSSDLTQSVDQEQEYGQDETYQDTTDYSGGSHHTIEIKDANNFAWFEFKGTGFELIASTQADSYATIVVTVIDTNNEAVERVPVILQYDNGDDGGTEEIYQVPVIRVDGLDCGIYKVYINGAPAYDYSQGKDEEGNYTAKESYLYLDGLRIYEPLGDTDAKDTTYDDTYYDDDEKNVTFAELRDLIATGHVASAVHKGATLKISTGTTTWTEDLHPNDSDEDNDSDDSDDSDEGIITANQVESVNDYLTKGPNNEVYINGSVDDAALVFYVKETVTNVPGNLQIAVHAVDEGLFVGSDSAGMNAAIQYGIMDGDTYKWEHLTTVTSGTEQYYTIPYESCPYVADKGYQVAIHVGKGMASFTSLKYNGLEIKTVIGEVTSLRYENGILVEAGTGEPVDAASYVDFQTVAYQMTEATVASAPGATEPTEPETQPSEPETQPSEPETQPTEPETTEPEATEPEATEPEATEPVETEPETTEPEESKPGQGNNKPGNGDSSGDNGKPENGNNNGKPGNNNSGNNGKPTESEKRENLWNSLMETIAYLMELLGKH